MTKLITKLLSLRNSLTIKTVSTFSVALICAIFLTGDASALEIDRVKVFPGSGIAFDFFNPETSHVFVSSDSSVTGLAPASPLTPIFIAEYEPDGTLVREVTVSDPDFEVAGANGSVQGLTFFEAVQGSGQTNLVLVGGTDASDPPSMIGTRTVKEYSKTTLTPAGDPLDLSFTGQLDRQEFEGITHTNGAIPDQGTFWIVGDGRDFDSPSEHQDLQERDPAGNHINGFRLDDDLNFPDIAIPAVQAMDFEGIGYNAETGSLLLIGNVANSEPKQSKLFDIGDGSFVQDEIDLTVMYGIRGAEGVAYDHVTKTLYVAVDPVRSCPDVPVPDCRPAGKAKLVLKAKKAKLAWRAKPGAETPIIGNPLEDTDYHLCLYDETAEDTELVLSARLPAGSSWSKSGLNVSYTSSGGNSNGITALNVATGKKNKIKAQGKGVDLPTLPLNQNEAVIVQLLNDVNECWESRFTAPSKKNNTKAFKDRIK